MQKRQWSYFAGTMHEGQRGLTEDLEYSQDEWSRHEAVMISISNPKTPEGAIAARAYTRLNELVAELELESSITDMAHQVSQSKAWQHKSMIQNVWKIIPILFCSANSKGIYLSSESVSVLKEMEPSYTTGLFTAP